MSWLRDKIKEIDWLIVFSISLLGLLLVILSIYLVPLFLSDGESPTVCEQLKSFFENQTAAVIIAFFSIILSYFIWHKQHNKEVQDEYLKEFLDEVFLFKKLKKKQILYRYTAKSKDRNKSIYWKEKVESIDAECDQVAGKIKIRERILGKTEYYKEVSEIKGIYKDFCEADNEWSNSDLAKKAYKKVNDAVDKMNEDLLDSIDNIKLFK